MTGRPDERGTCEGAVWPGSGGAALSVVTVVGERRDRAQRMLAALASQSCRHQLEVVLVDTAGAGASPLVLPRSPRSVVLRADSGVLPGRARWMGSHVASAPFVAFIEEHCLPDPGWSAAVLEAHRDGWPVVGYTLTNGSPDTYFYRSVFLAEYGPWSHPTAGGPADLLPGSNVSYARRVLDPFGDRLAGLLEIDFVLHESLRLRGVRFYAAPQALAAHQSYRHLSALLVSHFLFARIQAASRARERSWAPARRLLLALAVPPALPLLQVGRAWRVLRTHRERSAWLAGLPVTALIHLCEALGESVGLLAGAGRSAVAFTRLEIDADRASR